MKWNENENCTVMETIQHIFGMCLDKTSFKISVDNNFSYKFPVQNDLKPVNVILQLLWIHFGNGTEWSTSTIGYVSDAIWNLHSGET